ncbi:MAG TPA: hypothetical protein VJL90_14415 [Pseudorhodoplanes sp.]|nr:hypothetical protein [Pseudorhodoplanes sp.]
MNFVLDRAPEQLRAGRMCPADYRYSPRVFDRPADLAADILYVVGGLYGNLAALDVVERLASEEKSDVTIVFNGDFHWFDAEPDWFSDIDRRVGAHVAIRGNVETEIARGDDIGAGCGCAYPDTVDDGIVNRSNLILYDLRRVAGDVPGARARFHALPMHLVAKVGDANVAIVHGDAWSLAGWNFSHDALDNADHRPRLERLRHDATIDIFASTHTCLAALRNFSTPDGDLTVINNGAAGMPNFRDSNFGLMTRIATRPSPHLRLYGSVQGGAHIDAIPLEYDNALFLKRFLDRWPDGSAAHDSYFGRIAAGPNYGVEQAMPRAV